MPGYLLSLALGVIIGFPRPSVPGVEAHIGHWYGLRISAILSIDGHDSVGRKIFISPTHVERIMGHTYVDYGVQYYTSTESRKLYADTNPLLPLLILLVISQYCNAVNHVLQASSRGVAQAKAASASGVSHGLHRPIQELYNSAQLPNGSVRLHGP